MAFPNLAAWRNKEQMLCFVGEVCPHCGAKIFPPKAVCPICRNKGKKLEKVVPNSDQINQPPRGRATK